MFGRAQKGIKHWILNRFLLVNSEMWIRTAIKLPHDLGVCQKTEGNSAGDFHGGDERKTPTSWTRTAIKSPTTPCIWWKSLMSPWETITVRIGLKMTTNSSAAGNLYQARMGPNSKTKTPETHNLDAQTYSNCFEKKRRCYTMVNMPPSQLFWDL